MPTAGAERATFRCGIDQPVVGRLLERRVHRGAARIDLGNFGRLGVESERSPERFMSTANWWTAAAAAMR